MGKSEEGECFEDLGTEWRIILDGSYEAG